MLTSSLFDTAASDTATFSPPVLAPLGLPLPASRSAHEQRRDAQVAMVEREPVSRDEILDKVWGTKTHQPNNRTVDNFVVKLRKKIEEDAAKPRHIVTIYGTGYKLVV